MEENEEEERAVEENEEEEREEKSLKRRLPAAAPLASLPLWRRFSFSFLSISSSSTSSSRHSPPLTQLRRLHIADGCLGWNRFKLLLFLLLLLL